MKYKFRSTLVDSERGIAKNFNYEVNTDDWLDHMRAKPEMYWNVPDLVERHLFPALAANSREHVAEFIVLLEEQCLERNANIVFELAMFVWAGFKSQKYSAGVWAAVLGLTWQSGYRGMLASVALSQATVREMFRSVSHEAIHWAVDPDGETQRRYEQLPDVLQVYRGVSTGIDHYEEGFSWTTDVTEAQNFMAHNTHNDREIPGLLAATIPKEAILAVFEFENEVVVDPAVPKLEVLKHFLRGPELRNFRKTVNASKRSQELLFRKSSRAHAGMLTT